MISSITLTKRLERILHDYRHRCQEPLEDVGSHPRARLTTRGMDAHC